MSLMRFVGQRFDRLEEEAQMRWDPHLTYPALVPVYHNEEVGYGPGMSGAYRTGELPGQGWHGQSFANNPSPADRLRLGARVPTRNDALLAQLSSRVVM